MALKINYNFQSDFTHANMLKTEYNVNKNLERLATGHRINRAADDAAGLFIADQLKTYALSVDQGTRNAQDGISVAQIAQGALNEVYNILNDIKTKAIQAGNTTLDDDSRGALQSDINELANAIKNIFEDTEFNGKKLFDKDKDFTIQYGGRTGQKIEMKMEKVTVDAKTGSGEASTINLRKNILSTNSNVTVSFNVIDITNTQDTIENVDSLIKIIDKTQAYYGSQQIKLEKIISNNETVAVNTRDAEGRIRNIDFAKEMADFTKNNILMQSGTAMLAQANQQSQLVLQLLR
jgi:flagellin